jgi:hypothetical protein
MIIAFGKIEITEMGAAIIYFKLLLQNSFRGTNTNYENL